MMDPEIPAEDMERIRPMLESLRKQMADLEKQLPPAPACAIAFHPMESD